jgi:hypothetical protein
LDFLNKASIPTVGALNTTATTAQTTSVSESFGGAITLHKVAKTGSYNDLLNKPYIPYPDSTYPNPYALTFTGAVSDSYDGSVAKTIDIPSGGGTFAGTLNTSTSTQTALTTAISTNQAVTLHQVARTGNYNDLSDKPTIPAAQVQSDWNATTGMGVILNKFSIVQIIGTSTTNVISQNGLNNLYVPWGTRTSTMTSYAIGTNTNAGANCVAIGYNTNAGAGSIYASVAIGKNCETNSSSSVAIGQECHAKQKNCIVLGQGTADFSLNTTQSSPDYAFAVQGCCTASSTIGIQGRAHRDYAIAISGDVCGISGVAIGYLSNVYGNYSTALGYASNASGNYSVALGYGASVSSDNTIRLGNTNITQLICNSTTITTSDIRDKTDIKPIEKSLEFINSIEPIQYVCNQREKYMEDTDDEKVKELRGKYGLYGYNKEEYTKGTKRGDRRKVGFMAQEVEKIMMDLYNTDNYADIVSDSLHNYDKNDIPKDVESQKSISYSNFIPFLVGAIQELTKELNKVKAKLG